MRYFKHGGLHFVRIDVPRWLSAGRVWRFGFSFYWTRPLRPRFPRGSVHEM